MHRYCNVLIPDSYIIIVIYQIILDIPTNQLEHMQTRDNQLKPNKICGPLESTCKIENVALQGVIFQTHDRHKNVFYLDFCIICVH